jgi:hypothetical protein
MDTAPSYGPTVSLLTAHFCRRGWGPRPHFQPALCLAFLRRIVSYSCKIHPKDVWWQVSQRLRTQRTHVSKNGVPRQTVTEVLERYKPAIITQTITTEMQQWTGVGWERTEGGVSICNCCTDKDSITLNVNRGRKPLEGSRSEWNHCDWYRLLRPMMWRRVV